MRVHDARTLTANAKKGQPEGCPRPVPTPDVATTTARAQPAWRSTVDGVCEIHRRLLAGTPHEHFGGRIRTEQNWIGGSGYNPCAAAFVPPPADDVPALLEDLCTFVNSADLPAMVQAAIVHAQFETIHPFADGNGRTGRALIYVVLKRRGLIDRVSPPISLILATESEQYIAGLTAFRYVGSHDGEDARRGFNRWLATFASAALRAAEEAVSFEARIAMIQRAWRMKLGRVRANSAVDRLIDALPGAPIVTVASAAELIGRTSQATNEAFKVLVAAEILSQLNLGKNRNRAFEVPAVIEAFTDFERRLASPTGDTKRSPPVRTVPARVRS